MDFRLPRLSGSSAPYTRLEPDAAVPAPAAKAKPKAPPAASPPGVAGQFDSLAQLGKTRVNVDRAALDKLGSPVSQAIGQQLDEAKANGEFASVQRAKLNNQDVYLMFRGANGVSAFYEKPGQSPGVVMQNGTLGPDKKSVSWSPARDVEAVKQADTASQVQTFSKTYPLTDKAKAEEIIKDFQNNTGWLSVPGMSAGPGDRSDLRLITIKGQNGAPDAKVIEREAERAQGMSTYVIDGAPKTLAQDYRAKWTIEDSAQGPVLRADVTWKDAPIKSDAYDREQFKALLDNVFTNATASINRASAAR